LTIPILSFWQNKKHFARKQSVYQPYILTFPALVLPKQVQTVNGGI
jgi:hypothetical protein